MSTKDRVAEDVARAAQVGDPRDRLTRMIELLAQQQAQTNMLLQRLLPAASQAAPPLPQLAPRLSDRAEVGRLVDEHVHRTQELHRDVWRWLFRQWQRAGRGDGKTRLEDIARAGEMAEFLAFVREQLPTKPAHRDESAQRERAAPPSTVPNVFLASAIEADKIDPAEVARRSGLSLDTILRALRGNVPGQRTRVRIALALARTTDALWPADGSPEEQAFVKEQLDKALKVTGPDEAP